MAEVTSSLVTTDKNLEKTVNLRVFKKATAIVGSFLHEAPMKNQTGYNIEKETNQILDVKSDR